MGLKGKKEVTKEESIEFAKKCFREAEEDGIEILAFTTGDIAWKAVYVRGSLRDRIEKIPRIWGYIAAHEYIPFVSVRRVDGAQAGALPKTTIYEEESSEGWYRLQQRGSSIGFPIDWKAEELYGVLFKAEKFQMKPLELTDV